MNNYYGKYKNLRNASWHLLLDFNVNSLPVDVLSICKQMNITILSYYKGNEIINALGLESYCQHNDGFALCAMNQWFVFYRDHYFSQAQINFIIAHEIGHILLGHRLKTQRTFFQKVSVVEKKDTIETEADMFALRVLAPACVLRELHIHDYIDIMSLCYLPESYAKQRAKRLMELYRRDMFYTDQLEVRVKENFSCFIRCKQKDSDAAMLDLFSARKARMAISEPEKEL